ncbi:putative bifunctional diguanylate cyclase/phosphodiesterase [Dactylosporangium sp. CA-139066]|uniref:putative bifunctional diguanylate cyclase/phosphodiesterase n=1 Tax=Dactylosporangium sp. CA-139066 TaxID=3239930 RepID=UPI003D8DA938
MRASATMVSAGPARAHAWWWYLLAGVPLALLAPRLPAAGQELSYIAGAGSAIVMVVRALRRGRATRRRTWMLLAGAMGCATVANICWAVDVALGGPGAGMVPVEAMYFAMYPVIAAGLLSLPATNRYGSKLAGFTEAGIALCTAVVVTWVLLYDPFIRDQPGHTVSLNITLYPPLDLLILATAVRMVVATGTLRGTHLLLLAGTASLLTADVSYFVSNALGGSWAGPGFSVFCWTITYFFVGASVLHPSAAAPPAPARPSSSMWMTVVYAIVVLIGPAAAVYSLLLQVHRGGFDSLDVIVPLAPAAVTAVLLVVRLGHAGRAELRRSLDLQDALHQQSQMQALLRHHALHDALTGLPNRRLLDDRLTDMLRPGADPRRRGVAEGDGGGLVLFDLDGFKDVNDRFGHPTGDALLVAVARRLEALLDPGDTLARLGGDEFALLCPRADAAELLERGERMLVALRRPVEVGGAELFVSATAGARHFTAATGATTVLSDADVALYAAKAAGKDRVLPFDEQLRDEQLQRSRTAELLRAALAADELAVHYQPIVALDGQRIVGVEALVRWYPPGGAPIGPDRFIPVAEASGLIVALGDWVLARACRDAASWHARTGAGVSVNVSPRQLAEPDFVARVHRALASSGLPGPALTLEITEGVLVGAGPQAEQTIAHLTALRAIGVRVAIDDFGTGYSSLAYLRDLPIDILKIDRSFLPHRCDDVPGQTALVRAIVDLARSLSLTTVAEGVETPEHAELLRSLGCDRGQGYLLGRPSPAATIDDALTRSLTPA